MLRVAYISDNSSVKPKRLTPRQKLHQDALASLAMRKIHDRERALILFSRELDELEQLKLKLKKLLINT